MSVWPAIETAIGAATGARFEAVAVEPASGGCIHRCATLRGRDGRRYFVKRSAAPAGELLALEAAGLAELAGGAGPRVPAVICQGTAAGEAYLVLEHLELGPLDGRAAERLGERLAALHRRSAPRFGWRLDNAIGRTPQPNPPTADWVEFFTRHRLAHQLALAERAGHDGALQRDGARLCRRVAAFFPGYRPRPSLVHGDLWGGNAAAIGGGEPVIFDPAVYYGDRETDLAMSELFGRFPARFYAAYREAWPLDPGYATRRTLYNLYHVLNHLNLFGGSYLGQARAMIAELLAECR